MKRRDFLKGIVGGLASVGLPVGASQAKEEIIEIVDYSTTATTFTDVDTSISFHPIASFRTWDSETYLFADGSSIEVPRDFTVDKAGS